MKVLELPPGQPKLKSNDIAKEVAQRWNRMDSDTREAITDPLLDELMSMREEADTKPKIAPVHVLNDVSATMMKINREVRCYVRRMLGLSIDQCQHNPPVVGCLACSHRLRDHPFWSPVKWRPLYCPDRPFYKLQDTYVL